ncbi:hypothetical protein SBRCBS47491_003701 [Sporothrix bragantina]|uniref:Ankyrin repeat protein n=1 Tax=Sporothrix bragantina TaxID=671064 RepID=A0ABP0BHD4_9PEZI
MHAVLFRTPNDDLVEVVGHLKERDAPVNMTKYTDNPESLQHHKISDLGTPLHVAALMGKIEVVRYLLPYGADTSICSTKCRTTLQ